MISDVWATHGLHWGNKYERYGLNHRTVMRNGEVIFTDQEYQRLQNRAMQNTTTYFTRLKRHSWHESFVPSQLGAFRSFERTFLLRLPGILVIHQSLARDIVKCSLSPNMYNSPTHFLFLSWCKIESYGVRRKLILNYEAVLRWEETSPWGTNIR